MDRDFKDTSVFPCNAKHDSIISVFVDKVQGTIHSVYGNMFRRVIAGLFQPFDVLIDAISPHIIESDADLTVISVFLFFTDVPANVFILNIFIRELSLFIKVGNPDFHAGFVKGHIIAAYVCFIEHFLRLGPVKVRDFGYSLFTGKYGA